MDMPNLRTKSNNIYNIEEYKEKIKQTTNIIYRIKKWIQFENGVPFFSLFCYNPWGMGVGVGGEPK